ncbi:MAG: class II aldolase/adducin family protein [Lentisphaerae bacterium]|nr:class II aldolase/adducin family protein [Lentisphaerota bacterium]
MHDARKMLTDLSHEFGIERYVLGGGGNTSVKEGDVLWVKPSGATLSDMAPDRFVCLSRAGIDRLFAADLPSETHARESAVKTMMEQAVAPGSLGRPSVEAPLHHILPGRFVVHTHPSLVNGLTCGHDGAAACARLFPGALWVEYVDPGYTLCNQVREALAQHVRREGHAPACVMLQNHGIFISADTPDAIRHAYADVMAKLEAFYRQAGVSLALQVNPPPAGAGEDGRRALAAAMGAEAPAAVAVSGAFPLFRGPLTPDHVVYAGSFACRGDLARGSLKAFRAAHGAYPRVVEGHGAVYGIGATSSAALLALAFARDAALVEHLASAFGGPCYMDARARAFIESWEVEHYRRKVATGGPS